MFSNAHRTNSLGWQIRQAFQRLEEWWDYQLSRTNIQGPEMPDWGWLEPLGRGIFWVLVTALAVWTGLMLYRSGKIAVGKPTGHYGYWQPLAPLRKSCGRRPSGGETPRILPNRATMREPVGPFIWPG
jgi:hypothetical protein